ncbi:MAG: hypothetical protein ACE5LB_11320, partial [Acidiferrobacterales bacterium]
MRKLYLQIYLTFVGILLLFGVLLSVTWALLPTGSWHRPLEGMGAVVAELLVARARAPHVVRVETRMGLVLERDPPRLVVVLVADEEIHEPRRRPVG